MQRGLTLWARATHRVLLVALLDADELCCRRVPLHVTRCALQSLRDGATLPDHDPLPSTVPHRTISPGEALSARTGSSSTPCAMPSSPSRSAWTLCAVRCGYGMSGLHFCSSGSSLGVAAAAWAEGGDPCGESLRWPTTPSGIRCACQVLPQGQWHERSDQQTLR